MQRLQSFGITLVNLYDRNIGPSGGARTHGLVIPNHALFQLSYTWILIQNSEVAVRSALFAHHCAFYCALCALFCFTITGVVEAAGLEPTLTESKSVELTYYSMPQYLIPTTAID